MSGCEPVSLSLSSTNLNELAKAVRLLAALNVEGMTPDDLLKAARALAAATAGLLNTTKPENLEVHVHVGRDSLSPSLSLPLSPSPSLSCV